MLFLFVLDCFCSLDTKQGGSLFVDFTTYIVLEFWFVFETRRETEESSSTKKAQEKWLTFGRISDRTLPLNIPPPTPIVAPTSVRVVSAPPPQNTQTYTQKTIKNETSFSW